MGKKGNLIELRSSTERKQASAASLPPEALMHKELVDGDFWRKIPAYRDLSESDFMNHLWQARHTITKPKALLEALQGIVSTEFLDDVREGFALAPMAVRVSPYLLSLVDWQDPYTDPLRRQFIPLRSERLADHPKLGLDTLAEQADSPVPGLTHRYPDKALFLVLDTCPVYCRFCTRSYTIGPDSEQVEKMSLKVNQTRWQGVFDYVSAHPELEDIVVSGGDMYNLKADQLRGIGEALLSIDHVLRIRFATKGPAVMPQKILSDDAWFSALADTVEFGRKRRKEVALHTHFNNPNEITAITKKALDRLFDHGVTVRNQAVLQRGVNDAVNVMKLLVKRLSYVNVHPYYVYQHDLVKGVEDLRTTVETAILLEKNIRGVTAGFNTPAFVVDAPGGGGKRNIHSFEHYDKVTGISVYTAPSVKPGQYFLYFDPLHLLPEAGQLRWRDPAEHSKMVQEALDKARANGQVR
ncbi:MAG: KamA family radical SAM protein [Myxococcales bacterium]|nr:MAG: KamA family radical SAM protein [Myxococcales bacterium]